MDSEILSKSNYLNGLQCPKYLWVLFHEPERVPEPDAVTQYRFDQGHLVGELAKKLFPHGIDIPAEDFRGNIEQTKELLQQSNPLFEAGILAGSIYCRTDILNPVDDGGWDIIEVKSSTSVKDEHIHDVSFQKFCCEELGLKMRKCFLAYINNEYVKDGEIEPGQLFAIEDITAKVGEVSPGLQERIDAMFQVISAEQCPDILIGRQCSNPYDCPLREICWGFLPESNVFNLYYGGKKSFELFERGVLSIKEIPDDFKLNDKQQIQKMCEASGKPYVDKEGISNFLRALQYPLYYLDFETFNPAVPMFNGTRPYQKIPFQFSVHVVMHDKSRPEHFSFLAEGTEDPRPEVLSELKKVLGDKGSIVVYNKSFEEGVLKGLGGAFPEYATWVGSLCDRMVDLLAPFRSFYYYHPGQRGSASLKSVLPVLTGKGYEGLDIADGEDASLAFLEATYGDISDEMRNKIREDLQKYCGLDSEGMVWIIDRLKELA